jgi:hypothetical protein
VAGPRRLNPEQGRPPGLDARHYGELDRRRLQVIADRLPAAADAVLESFFGQLLEWARKPRWSGSGFTRLVVELADLPGHPARAIARRSRSQRRGRDRN